MRILLFSLACVVLAVSVARAEDQKPSPLQLAEARVVKLEREALALQQTIAELRLTVADREARLAGCGLSVAIPAADQKLKDTEAALLKAAGAKPGQVWNWTDMKPADPAVK